MNRVPQLVLANVAVLALGWALELVAFVLGGLAGVEMVALRVLTVAVCVAVSTVIVRATSRTPRVDPIASAATAATVVAVNVAVVGAAYVLLVGIAPYGVGSVEVVGLIAITVLGCTVATVLVLRSAARVRTRGRAWPSGRRGSR